MTLGTRTREDCRGEDFSGLVVVGYPLKNGNCNLHRWIGSCNAGKKSTDKKSGIRIN